MKRELLTLPPAKPRFIHPMILSEVRELPESQEWVYEAMLDGLSVRGGQGRQGDALVEAWKSLHGPLSRWRQHAKSSRTVVDGEVVAIDENGRASFNLLQYHASKPHLQFYAFDMPVYRGRILLHVALETPRELLEEALEKVDYPVLFSRTFDAKPADLIRAAKELRFEGIIAKRKRSCYVPGRRTTTWVKYKLNQCQEFVIGGFTRVIRSML